MFSPPPPPPPPPSELDLDKGERFSAVDFSFRHFSEMEIDSRACFVSPWQRLMRLRVLRLDNWWIEEVTERNVMTVFGVGDGNECS